MGKYRLRRLKGELDDRGREPAAGDLAAWRRGKPDTIQVEFGPIYISGTLLEWAEMHQITIRHIQLGPPLHNASIERSNRTVRHKWLDQYGLCAIENAQDCAK